jgi:hypothetical protein
MPVQLEDIMTGLGMLGGVLSTPRRIQYQQQQNEMTRALLQGSGIPQADIAAATPEPSMRWLSPQQGGFTGKVLGGVGDVGALLSTIVGKPLTAPRASLSDLAAASKMRSGFQQQQAKTRLVNLLKDPKAKREDVLAAAAEAGAGAGEILRGYGVTGPKAPGSLFAARTRLAGLDPNSDEYKQLKQSIADQEAREDAKQAARDAAMEKRYHPPMDPGLSEQKRHDQQIKDRQADAERLGLQPGTKEYKDYVYGYGAAGKPPAGPKPLSYEKIVQDQARIWQQAHKGRALDQAAWDAVHRNAYQFASGLVGQGQTVEGFDPNDPAMKPPPPKPPSLGPTAPPMSTTSTPTSAGARVGAVPEGGGETEPTTPPPTTSTTFTPTTPTTTTTAPPSQMQLPPEWAWLDDIVITTPEQKTQAEQLVAALQQGMPMQAAKNWAKFIEQMPATQQQVVPR